MKTFAITTLGCKVNYYDSGAITKLLIDDGYILKNFDCVADIYIVNTCSVTSLSDKKSRQFLHRARRLNKNAVIVAMGCHAQVMADDLIKNEMADIVIGTNNRQNIIKILDDYKKNKNKIKKVSNPRYENTFEEICAPQFDKRTRSFIKIQEGCDKFCSYCLIPYTRGKSRSRNFYDIIQEVEKLCGDGFKEIVLTGIDISVYGQDFGEQKNKFNLINLIEKLHEIKNLARIRLSSVEPNLIDHDFLNASKYFTKLCPHFHMSLQSGSDKILNLMNRKYTTKKYLESSEKLKSIFKNVSLTTDIIVGFPGETEHDFELTYEFAKKIGFSKIHVFPYSSRKNTRAYDFSDKVNSSIKKERVKKLISLGQVLSRSYKEKFLNKTLPVLFEEKTESGYIGYSDNYIRIFSPRNSTFYY